MSKTYATVPRLWPGETFILLASGPSLTQADCDAIRGQGRVIAINSSYKLALWADVLYACDAKWWRLASTDKKKHPRFPEFHGLKYALTMESARYGAQVLKNTGPHGLELNPSGLKTGSNSGYQAVNLAVHLGAARIILLGYDMQRGPKGEEHHHADDFGGRSPYANFRRHFQTIVAPLDALGIQVINCTRRTALEWFPCQPLETVFASHMEAVA